MDTLDTKSKKVRTRGVGTFDPSTNEFGFSPFNDAPSTQANVKTCAGGGKRWTTTGADPSRMLTLKCKESAADPYAELSKQFAALTKDMKPKKPVEQPTEQRVVAEGGLQCWLNTETGELAFSGSIDLTKHTRDWAAEVLRQVQLMVRRLPANERFNTIIKSIKKDSNHV